MFRSSGGSCVRGSFLKLERGLLTGVSLPALEHMLGGISFSRCDDGNV